MAGEGRLRKPISDSLRVVLRVVLDSQHVNVRGEGRGVKRINQRGEGGKGRARHPHSCQRDFAELVQLAARSTSEPHRSRPEEGVASCNCPAEL